MRRVQQRRMWRQWRSHCVQAARAEEQREREHRSRPHLSHPELAGHGLISRYLPGSTFAAYSFKTPADQHVDNTGDTLLLPAPKGFQAGAEPVVNDDEKC